MSRWSEVPFAHLPWTYGWCQHRKKGALLNIPENQCLPPHRSFENVSSSSAPPVEVLVEVLGAIAWDEVSWPDISEFSDTYNFILSIVLVSNLAVMDVHATLLSPWTFSSRLKQEIRSQLTSNGRKNTFFCVAGGLSLASHDRKWEEQRKCRLLALSTLQKPKYLNRKIIKISWNRILVRAIWLLEITVRVSSRSIVSDHLTMPLTRVPGSASRTLALGITTCMLCKKYKLHNLFE